MPAKKAAPKSAKGAKSTRAKTTTRASTKKARAADRPAKKTVAKGAVTKKAPTPRPPGTPPIEKTRVVMPMDFYEPHKDEIKAPFKAHELKWNYLGEGKGLYKRADGGVHCFTQFKDDGVHYSLWGADKKARDAILATWKGLLGPEAWKKATASGEQAAAAEEAQKGSEAVRLWKLAEPQRRPGEPDLFFDKRRAEWEAKKPA